MPIERTGRWMSWGPELALAVVASLAFLGCLGSTELWGRREQRAAAEAVDTVAHGHWLVGQIQGRPRLEKPPLPRWITAGLMLATGRRDEVAVRLANALAALAVVALVYGWGRAVGGRAVGLASGFALAATPFFVVEMRQAGNDGMLTLFVALALVAAARRWGIGRGDEAGPRIWNLVFCASVGLGFLCKGPVIGLWVGVPILGFLASRRRLKAGLRLLIDGPGLVILAVLMLVWPALVVARYPGAAGVWWLEMGQKTGVIGVEHGNARGSILAEALGMTVPWTPLLLAALVSPVRRWWWRRVEVPAEPPALGLAWWWAFGPLAVLGTWDVAKPNYLLPALPAVAVLAGAGWIELTRRARDAAHGISARWCLQVAWSALFAAAVVAPVVAHELNPAWLVPTIAASLILAASTLASARAWRLGRDSASLATLASGLIAVGLLGYGAIAPTENAARGHRALAAELSRTLPPGTTAWFFDDLDEAVWFYGPNLNLQPVPPLTTIPPTNRGHTLRTSVTPGQGRAEATAARTRAAVDQLTAWADGAEPNASLLVRGKLLDRLGAALPPRFAPVRRETGVKRNELVLLRVRTAAEVAALPTSVRR